MKLLTKRALLLLALALACALLLGWAPGAAAAGGSSFEEEDEDESDKTDVAIDLSIKAYEAAMASRDVWVIDYFQEDCAPCMQIKTFMEQLAKDVHPYGVKVGVFDTKQSKQAQKLAIAAGLVKLPALKLFVGPPEKNPYTGKLFRPSVDYLFQEGAGLDTKMIKKWVTKNLPNHVVQATAEGWSAAVAEAFQEEGRSAAVVLTDRATTPALLKTMAIKYGESFAFLEVPEAEARVHEAFGVAAEDLAALFLLPAAKGADAFTDLGSLQKGSAIKFDGEFRESGPLEAFLEKHRAPKPKQAAAADGKKKAEAEAGAETGKEKEGKGKKGEGNKPPAFRVLDAGTFKGEVYKDADNAWLVWFKPSADATHPDWEKHLAKSEGLLRVGVVDCGNATNAGLCARELGAAGANRPFRAYPVGDEKEDEAKGFDAPAGAYAECGESVPDVLRRIGDGGNQMLVDQEVNAAFGAYKFPVIVVTNKPEPALLFKALALKLEPFLHFVLVSSPSAQFLQRFNNANVPSVHILVPQDIELYKDVSQGLPTQHALRIESYLPGMIGPMNFVNIANFLVQVVALRADPQKAQTMAQHISALLTGQKPAAAGASSASSGGGSPAAVSAVADAAAWAAACPQDGALLCVVGLFRGGEQAAGVSEQVAMLQEVAGKEGSGAERPWAFAWADGTCLTEFADAFDVQEPKLPTVVVYSPRKQRFANFKGTLSAPAVSEFLRGILSGSIAVAPVLREPRVDADTGRCTGLGVPEGAGAADDEAPVEEEEDIGDLMAEILAEEKRKKEELAAALERDAEEAKKKAEEAAAAADAEPKKKIVRRKKKKASDEL